MKKILLVFTAFFSVLLFTSCNPEIDHPIAGNVYVNFGKEMSVYIYFHLNGEFEIDFMEKTILGEYKHNKYDHMEWKIDGNKIRVYHDNSTYWKADVRGTLQYEGTYNSLDNTIILDGQLYEHSHKWD